MKANLCSLRGRYLHSCHRMGRRWWLVIHGMGWVLSMTPLWWYTGWRLSWFWLGWSLLVIMAAHDAVRAQDWWSQQISAALLHISAFLPACPCLRLPLHLPIYLSSSPKLFPLLPTLPCTLSPSKFFLHLTLSSSCSLFF